MKVSTFLTTQAKVFEKTYPPALRVMLIAMFVADLRDESFEEIEKTILSGLNPDVSAIDIEINRQSCAMVERWVQECSAYIESVKGQI